MLTVSKTRMFEEYKHVIKKKKPFSAFILNFINSIDMDIELTYIYNKNLMYKLSLIGRV